MRSTLLWLLAACGGDDSDATPDTGAPTSEETGAPDPVDSDLVVTVASGGPFVGTTVASHAPDGSVLGTAVTDLDGRVVFGDFPAGGGITALVPGATNRAITMLGLSPGRSVAVNPDLQDREPVGSIDVTLDAAYAPAEDYTIGGGCVRPSWEPGITRTYEVTRNCVGAGGAVSFVALAYGGPEYQILAYGLAEDVQIGSAVTIDTWSTSFSSFPINVSNTTGGSAEVQVGYRGVDQGVTLYEDVRPPVRVSAGDTLSDDMDKVIGALDTVRASVAVSTEGEKTRTRCTVQQVFAGVPGGVTVDTSTGLLPRPLSVGLDPNARELSWNVASDSRVDGIFATITGTIGTQDHVWYIVSPVPDSGALTLPELPEAFAGWWDPAEAWRASVIQAGSTLVDDYAEFGTAFPPAPLFDLAEPGQSWACTISPS